MGRVALAKAVAVTAVGWVALATALERAEAATAVAVTAVADWVVAVTAVGSSLQACRPAPV